MQTNPNSSKPNQLKHTQTKLSQTKPNQLNPTGQRQAGVPYWDPDQSLPERLVGGSRYQIPGSRFSSSHREAF